MKVVYAGILMAFLLALNGTLHAQTILSGIRGKVLLNTNQPAEASTVILIKAQDSSIVNSTTANKTGAFQFNAVPANNYLLLISKLGYRKIYGGPYHVEDGKIFEANNITLNPVAKQLNEVVVVSSRPDIEVKPGKITLNVPSSLTATGNSAFDILRQSPGVRVDNTNNISIIGRQSALITIDGKPTNLSGDDLVSILKSLQFSMIDRIELITSGSAKYDASAGGIINIVLKKGKNIGANATITGGAGYGKYYKDNIGIVFNDRFDKFNIFGGYNYTENKTFHNFTTNREINYDNILSDYDVNYNSVQKSKNNNFNLGADYAISSNHSIGILVNGYVRSDDFVKDDNLKIYNQSVLDSTIATNSNLHRHISSVNYNLNYNGKLDKAGKTLSADFNYTTHSRTSNEYITNDFYDASGSVYRDPLLLQNLSPSTIHIWLGKMDFSAPLSKNSRLEAGAKYSRVTSNNDLIFGPLVDGVYQSDPNFSNHFLYQENVNAAYVSYENKFKKFDLTAGLRAEQTIVNGNTMTTNSIVSDNYVDLFPQIQLVYSKDSKNDFSLSFKRGIKRPAYEDINPFLYYVDLYDYRSGNPNLKPEYSNSVELSHTYNKTIVTTLYANITSNAYEFPFYEQNDSSKVNINTNRNLGDVYTYGFRIFAPVTFTSWWNANFYADASYQRYVAYPQNGNLDKGTQDIVLTTTQNFIISKTLSAEISGNYESPNFYGIQQYATNYYINAGIGKQILHNMGSIRLNASDIFNTRRDKGHVDYENLNLTTVDKRESQVARLTFTYRFGKTTVKAAAAHRTGNEDEQKRTNAVN